MTPTPEQRAALSREQADSCEAEIRSAEADPAVDKHAFRLLLQSAMPCGHSYSDLLLCDAPPFGCVRCTTDQSTAAALTACEARLREVEADKNELARLLAQCIAEETLRALGGAPSGGTE